MPERETDTQSNSNDSVAFTLADQPLAEMGPQGAAGGSGPMPPLTRGGSTSARSSFNQPDRPGVAGSSAAAGGAGSDAEKHALQHNGFLAARDAHSEYARATLQQKGSNRDLYAAANAASPAPNTAGSSSRMSPTGGAHHDEAAYPLEVMNEKRASDGAYAS